MPETFGKRQRKDVKAKKRRPRRSGDSLACSDARIGRPA